MRVVLASIFAAGVIATVPYMSRADSAREVGGLAAIHKLHIENGRLCMADHEHFGQTGTWARQELAKSSAIRSWIGFTRLEYGEVWSDFELAAGKGVDCQAVVSRGGGWTCSVTARPCRR